MKFDIWVFFENLTRVTATLHDEDLCKFVIVFRCIISKMRNISNKPCRQNQNTLFVFTNFCFRNLCRLWDSVDKCGGDWQATDYNTIRRMRFGCWITKATQTHTCNMQYLLLFHGSSGCVNVCQCYFIRTLLCCVFLAIVCGLFWAAVAHSVLSIG
jgi:hypothetical protein